MEFIFEYGVWELLRHEKTPETHVLATLLSVNALLLMEKKISCMSSMNKLFQIFFIFHTFRFQVPMSYFRFLEVCVTQV